jgi:hypothetical protein
LPQRRAPDDIVATTTPLERRSKPGAWATYPARGDHANSDTRRLTIEATIQI